MPAPGEIIRFFIPYFKESEDKPGHPEAVKITIILNENGRYDILRERTFQSGKLIRDIMRENLKEVDYKKWLIKLAQYLCNKFESAECIQWMEGSDFVRDKHTVKLVSTSSLLAYPVKNIIQRRWYCGVEEGKNNSEGWYYQIIGETNHTSNNPPKFSYFRSKIIQERLSDLGLIRWLQFYIYNRSYLHIKSSPKHLRWFAAG